MILSRYSLALALVFPAAVLASAQQPAPEPQQPGGQPGYTLDVKSQLVVLDVVVTDKKGKAVQGLTRDDFQVFENKVPQKVLSFEAPKPPAAQGAPVPIHSTADLDRAAPQAPVSIIVLDEVTTKFEDEAFARYSLKKYLGTQGDTLQQPTMLMAVNFQHEMVLRDYTTSKKDILDALDRHFASADWRQKNGSWQAEQFAASFALLETVAEATAGHAGHKNLIWVGRGFPSIRWDQLPQQSVDALQQLIASCTDMLRDARVTLYSIDPAGISAEVPATDGDGFNIDDPFGGQVDFDEMARATGGQAFHGRNDVNNLIGTSVSDGEVFYTLTYKPSEVSTNPKEFRNITVKMANRLLTANTREGYFVGEPPVAPMVDAKGKVSGQSGFDIAMASDGLMVYDAVPITVRRAAEGSDDFLITLPASSITWQPTADDKQTGDLALVLETFDRKGKMLNRRASMLTLSMAALGPGESETRTAHVKGTIATAPPVARVRIIVRSSGTGKIGADNYFLVDRKTLADPSTGLKPQK